MAKYPTSGLGRFRARQQPSPSAHFLSFPYGQALSCQVGRHKEHGMLTSGMKHGTGRWGRCCGSPYIFSAFCTFFKKPPWRKVPAVHRLPVSCATQQCQTKTPDTGPGQIPPAAKLIFVAENNHTELQTVEFPKVESKMPQEQSRAHCLGGEPALQPQLLASPCTVANFHFLALGLEKFLLFAR